MIYLSGAEVYVNGAFIKTDVLTVGEKIVHLGTLLPAQLQGLDVESLDCKDLRIIPGLVDPHLHLSGGSGERGGFSTQSLGVLLSECVGGGVTTLVGTLGVDTTTKTMPDLIGRAKAYRELGLTAYCYTGGYDCPPHTMTDSVRNDIIFIEEIIGVGELAIADPRAPEPLLHDLARASIDAYVGGMLSNKPGITHIHAGPGEKRLKTVRDLLAQHEVFPRNLHITHIGRSRELMVEAVDLAKRGCYVDLDLWERDFAVWYKVYRELDGPLSQLTVSSDAGQGAPAELWYEMRDYVLKEGVAIEEILPHFTLNTATALRLKNKGRIAVGADADLAVYSVKDLEMKYVISRGSILMRNGKFCFGQAPNNARRDFDIYGIRKED